MLRRWNDHVLSLRGVKRRSNPTVGKDYIASFVMTQNLSTKAVGKKLTALSVLIN
ncbi:hypothetical protein KKA13_03595 [Patescibacteria group bacterium]|nr:hypothetical protein [Patescibacteria group bacterium]